MDRQTIDGAMARGELTENEAYFILRFAGHAGYDKAIKRLEGKPFRRLRKWFVWFGGWENPTLSQWDRGASAWQFRLTIAGVKKKWMTPFPLSLFGGRITFFGRWAQMRWGKGYLVASSDYAYKWPTRLYWSPDGTPSNPKAKYYFGRDRRNFA